ncbi:hypothetical protein AAHA92_18035 [Salvia divinorum]|uniref:Uncharacterized protein n=1 Tax=Salvia divinorum TaxID=28513 RepID=A0ABD1H0S2_SALDI
MEYLLSLDIALILEFQDNGFKVQLSNLKTTSVHQIDMNERIVILERLNPTARPTTSPFLEASRTSSGLDLEAQGFLPLGSCLRGFPQHWQVCQTWMQLFMLSYLDEEIPIIRDTAGIPEVLTRL